MLGVYMGEVKGQVKGVRMKLGRGEKMGGVFREKNVTKTVIYWGSYSIHIFVFLNPLQIFVPHLEILFFINNYFLVFIFNYCTILLVSSVI